MPKNRVVTNAILSPIFPLPTLYRVRGGWVPNEPTEQGEPKPVMQLPDDTLNIHVIRERHQLADVQVPHPLPVRVWAAWEGPSYTGRGEVDRFVIRMTPLTRMPNVPQGDPSIPSPPPILAVLRPHLVDVWRQVAAHTGIAMRELAQFPSWHVVLIPTGLFYRAVGVDPDHVRLVKAQVAADETVRLLI